MELLDIFKNKWVVKLVDTNGGLVDTCGEIFSKSESYRGGSNPPPPIHKFTVETKYFKDVWYIYTSNALATVKYSFNTNKFFIDKLGKIKLR